MGVRVLWGTSSMSLYKSKPNQVYPPNLLAVSGLSVVNRSLSAMADIPTRSSNPNMYSPLQFYSVLLLYLLFQPKTENTPLAVPPSLQVNNYSKYLNPYKFVVSTRIAVPGVRSAVK